MSEHVPASPARQLARHLRPGEELLWSGRPDPAVHFTGADAFLIPFTVLWGGFAVVWNVGVNAAGAPVFMRLWGLPFLAVGAYITVGRFVVKQRRKRVTAYGVTPDRVLIAVGTRRLVESPVRGVPTSTVRSRDGRHVSVTFGTQPAWMRGGMYANTGMDFFMRGSAGPGVAFYDVAPAEPLLSALKKAATAPAG